jgi:hypothetical protein
LLAHNSLYYLQDIRNNMNDMALELIKQVNGTNGPSLHDDMDPTQSPLPYQEDVPNIEGLILPNDGTPTDATKGESELCH